MEHEETSWYHGEVRSILGEIRRIVLRMDDVYDATSRDSPPAQFFVLNMITQARRLRNDWQRLVNNDKTILDEFDRWKDRKVFEQTQQKVQARGLENRYTIKDNRVKYDRPEQKRDETEPKAGPPKLPNDLRCWNFTRQGKRCNFDPYYKCIKHSKFARLQKGINDDATIPSSVVHHDYSDSDDERFVNSVDRCLALNIPVVGDEHAYKLDRYGQPEMPSIIESPLMYLYIKWNL